MENHRGLNTLANSDTLSADFVNNIINVKEHFNLTFRDYLYAALKQQALFTQKDKTIISNIEGVVEHFKEYGLTTEKYLAAALINSQLFSQKSETIIGNIKGVVEHFEEYGLTTEKYLVAAIKQPALYYQKPETIIGNIEGVVKQFEENGLTKEKYLTAAIKQPQLFSQNPNTIGNHIRCLMSMYESAILTTNKCGNKLEMLTNDKSEKFINFFDVLIKNNPILALSYENYSLRTIDQIIKKTQNSQEYRPITMSSYRQQSRYDVESGIIDFLKSKNIDTSSITEDGESLIRVKDEEETLLHKGKKLPMTTENMGKAFVKDDDGKRTSELKDDWEIKTQDRAEVDIAKVIELLPDDIKREFSKVMNGYDETPNTNVAEIKNSKLTAHKTYAALPEQSPS